MGREALTAVGGVGNPRAAPGLPKGEGGSAPRLSPRLSDPRAAAAGNTLWERHRGPPAPELPSGPFGAAGQTPGGGQRALSCCCETSGGFWAQRVLPGRLARAGAPRRCRDPPVPLYCPRTRALLAATPLVGGHPLSEIRWVLEPHRRGRDLPQSGHGSPRLLIPTAGLSSGDAAPLVEDRGRGVAQHR